MSATGKFATAINCMDGRTQEPIINFMRHWYRVDYVDMINEPGPVKALAEYKNYDFLKTISNIELQANRIKIAYMKKIKDTVNAITFAEAGEHEFARSLLDVTIMESILRRMIISIRIHGSRVVAIVAHHDCAGNPVDKEKQIKQLDASIDTLRSWGFKVEYIKLWVDRNWQVQLIN